MKIVCTSCGKNVGEVVAVARLILTVHCPFDGNDFGVAVDPVEPAVVESAALDSSAPAST